MIGVAYPGNTKTYITPSARGGDSQACGAAPAGRCGSGNGYEFYETLKVGGWGSGYAATKGMFAGAACGEVTSRHAAVPSAPRFPASVVDVHTKVHRQGAAHG